MKITKAQYSANIVENQFFVNDFRELIAHFSGVSEGVTAFLQMNYPEELVALSKAPDAGLYRKLLAEALVTLIDRNALSQLAELNDLAQSELVKLRQETGIGLEHIPTPPSPQPTAKQLLEERVINDWHTLKSADIRKNCANDRAYRVTFERLCAEDKLDSVATTNHRINEDFSITSRR